MTDMADDVQPDEGQGGEAGGGAPWESYLDRIPEEARDAASEAFREFDANTTKKFQEASEYRKGWEPFEELGVNQRDPEEVAWAMQMLDAVQSNPQAVNDWFQTYAQEHGLTPAQAAQQAEEDGYVDPSQAQWLEQQLGAHLGPVAQQLQELTEWREAQEQQREQARVRSEIDSEMEALKAKHPDEFSEPMVEKFIANHMNEADPRTAVQKAFSDWQAVRGQIEKETLQGKANVPAGAESGGTAATAEEPARTWQDAKAQAIEMLRANNTT